MTASGVHASIRGVRIEHFGVPGLGPDSSINQKSWVLVNNLPHPELLSKRCRRHGDTGRQEILLIRKAVGKVISGTYIGCDSVNYYLGHVLS